MIDTAALGLLTVHRVRVQHLEARDRDLTLRVEEAVSRLRILKGLLPTCSWCKKIRDDRGYWSQGDAYIRERSEADFSHGSVPKGVRTRTPRDASRPSDYAGAATADP